jgi:hypothetical protein
MRASKNQKPGWLSLQKGNPAILLGPVAFRLHLAMDLATLLKLHGYSQHPHQKLFDLC